MTPHEYRTHKNRALRAAFLSGELVGLRGGEASSNPYRVHGVGLRHPTRGGWSESYARAWSLGRQEGARQLARLEAVSSAREMALADDTGEDDG